MASPSLPITDEKQLKLQLSKLKMDQICGNTNNLSLQDIINQIKQNKINKKLEDIEIKINKKIHDVKTFNLYPLKKTNNLNFHANEATSSSSSSPSSPFNKRDDSINRFHIGESYFDLGAYPDEEMKKALYRVPCTDSSGTVYFEVERCSKHSNFYYGKWIPADKTLRPLPPAASSLCNITYQKKLMNHSNCVINNVEKEYMSMPIATESQRQLRARVGANLTELKRTKNKLISINDH